MYYSTMKRFGMEKRDILVDRVRDAQKAQTEAKEEFQTALERFKAVIEVEDSSLERKYQTLSKELERSEQRASAVHDRIKAVRDVSDDLFKEWQKELGKYADRSLRAESERDLRETRRRADTLIASMTRAERRIAPVLTPLRDRVLFLKHNLNARAIGALGKELSTMRGDVDSLVADLGAAITEADAFIKEMDAEKAATGSK
jgi:type I site-specific restriction endonuclease